MSDANDQASPKLAPEDAYLSYYDVRLTKEDVDSIKKGDWLTDNAISFWEEYLEHETLKKYPGTRITLLRPTMCQLLRLTPDPLSLKTALPDLTNTTHIFLPVNNSTNPEIPESGSHWSLLVVSVLDGVAFHYDSLGSDNELFASLTCEKLATLLGKCLRFVGMRDAPQQENGSDCGVFVCKVMEKLLTERLLKVNNKDKVSMNLKGRGIDARTGRKEMMKTIEGFRREGERRRSRSRSPGGGRSSEKSSPPRIGAEQEEERERERERDGLWTKR